MDRLGVQFALTVASASARGIAAEIAAQLGDRAAGTFGEVAQHVPADVAQRARAAAAACGADGLLAIGGGSAIGVAKAVALTSGLPIVAVPTTYSGSEMTPIWGVTDGGRKTTGRSPEVLPKVVVYDPELTLSLPAAVSATSGFNALAHAVEALWAPGANPATDALAVAAIRALAEGLPAVVRAPGELEGRARALSGAHLAGAALAAGTSLHHRLCHVLGGAYDLPHAQLHTVLLPHVVAFMEPGLPACTARVRDALDPDAASAAAALRALAAALGAPATLREIGLRADRFDAAVALAAASLPDELPVAVGADDVRGILLAAFGERG